MGQVRGGYIHRIRAGLDRRKRLQEQARPVEGPIDCGYLSLPWEVQQAIESMPPRKIPKAGWGN